MSFSLSGSVITQSGTDTSLAGLVGIAGVTVTGTGRKKTYLLASRQLVVTGVLTLTPELEELVFDEACPDWALDVNAGTLTIGSPGRNRPRPISAITFRRAAPSANNTAHAQLVTRLGATFAWHDGTIHAHGSVLFGGSSAAITLSAGMLHLDLSADQRGRLFLNRDVTIGNLFTVTGNGVQTANAGRAENMTIADCDNIGIHALGQGTLTTPYTVSGVTLLGGALYPWEPSVWSAIALAGGGTIPKQGGGISSGSQLIRTYGSANVRVTAAGSPVQAAKVFSRDTNNGSRSSFTCGSDGATYNGVPDTYALSPTNSSGETGSVQYLLQAWSRSAAGVVTVDWRTLTPGQNTRQVNVKGYTIKPVGVVVDLTAAGTLQQPVFAEADPGVTLSESAAGALTTIATWDDLYDILKWWSVQDANLETPSASSNIATSSGGVVDLGAYSLAVDASAASVLSVSGSTITVKTSTLAAGAKHASLTTTGTVTTANGATITGLYTDSAGTHTTITAASIVAGSRVQLYSVTDSTELLNTVLASTGLTYATTWTADKTIRLRADHPDYLPLEATGILTASGLQFLAAQEADTVYIGNGIDGSTVTEFEADGLAIHVDVDDPDGYTLVQRLYAWLQHYQTTEAGIASAFFGAMTASDSANYVIDQDKADIHLDNVTASPLMIVGGYLTRKDGSTVIAATSGSIQMDPGRAYVAPGGAAITVPEGERVVTLAGSGAYFARG